MTNQRHPIRALIPVVASLLWVCALVWAPAALAAAEDAGITGTVVNGTTDKPVPGLEVTLHLLTQQTELGALTATTDEDGVFSFPPPSAGAQGFQVTATYKAVAYQSPVTEITADAPAPVTLNVYETTTDPADVRQSSWIIWVDRDTAGAAVQHDIEWKNAGDTAYIGDQTGPDGSPIVTQVPLAPGATNLQFLGTYLTTPGQVQESTFVHPEPIVPGATNATLRYTAADLTELELPITLPTDTLQLFVPIGVEVSASGLAAAGQVTDQGTTYQVLTATNLQGGDTVDVTLQGLVGGGRSPMAFVILGTILVAMIGALAVWRLGRRREQPGRRAPARGARARASTPRRKGRPGAPARRIGRSAHAPVRAAAASRNGAVGADGDSPGDADLEADDEFDLLIEEIAALDLSYERGLLDQRTYEGLRGAAKRRLQRMRSAPNEGRPAR